MFKLIFILLIISFGYTSGNFEAGDSLRNHSSAENIHRNSDLVSSNLTNSQEPLEKPESVEQDVSPSEIPNGITEDESLNIGDIISQEKNSITFVASNQTAVHVNITNWTNGTQFSHVVELSSEFNILEESLIRGSMLTPPEILPSQGFVHTVISAYKDHHNLVIRPDDIWTAILVQFSRYVNANAEALRHHFVSHTGQKTIRLNLNSLSGSTGGPLTASEWKRCLNHIYKEAMKSTNNDLSWFVPNNFTTTKPADTIVSNLVFMSAMQHYFKYDVAVYCGIPQIKILGQTADWVKIRDRVEFIKTFGSIPKKWSELLLPIIDQFIRARSGDIDGTFWSDIVRIQKNAVCGGKQQESILDGWITTFSVFDRSGTWRGERLVGRQWPKINMKHVPSGVVRVPVNILSNGRYEHQEATLFAGHMGHMISADRKTLRPYTGWAVAMKDRKDLEEDEMELETYDTLSLTETDTRITTPHHNPPTTTRQPFTRATKPTNTRRRSDQTISSVVTSGPRRQTTARYVKTFGSWDSLNSENFTSYSPKPKRNDNAFHRNGGDPQAVTTLPTTNPQISNGYNRGPNNDRNNYQYGQKTTHSSSYAASTYEVPPQQIVSKNESNNVVKGKEELPESMAESKSHQQHKEVHY